MPNVPIASAVQRFSISGYDCAFDRTPRFDLLGNGITNGSRLVYALFPRSGEGRGIGEIPMEHFCAWKDRAAFGCFITDRDGIREKLATLENIEDLSRLVAADVDTHLFHYFDGEWVYDGGFRTRAFGFEFIATHSVHQRSGHLASGAIVNTEK
jgi:hypothetical protein